MIVLVKDIWKNGEEFKLELLTEEMILQAEDRLGVKLPTSYLSILKQQNGGAIPYNSHPCNEQTAWSKDHVYIDHIRGIGSRDGILDSEYLIKEWGLPKNIVVISGDCHTWIAFDYRKKRKEPTVIYIDSEEKQIVELAPNFEAFLDALTNRIEDESIELTEQQMYSSDKNDCIIKEIDETINSESPQKIEKKFNEILGFHDAEIEKYTINKLKSHESVKVRSSIGSYLLACAIGDNKVLDLEFVRNTLLDMSRDKSKSVLVYITAGLEVLGDNGKRS